LTRPPTEFDPDRALLVGRIVGAHGLRGEIRVNPVTDFPERFEPGSELWIDGEPVTVGTSRWDRRLVYVKLRGVSTRAAAEALVGKELHVPEESSLLGEGQFFRHDVIGLRVREEDGDELGRVVDILHTGANDVYVVHGERGELLLPALDDVVKQVDVGRGEMVVALMEGLEFSPPATRRPRRRREETTGQTS
jgi:16S rRNA processing protein RimM